MKNRQRGFLALLAPYAAKLILYGVIAAVIAGTVYGIYFKVMHWCNTACVQVTAERDQLAGTLKAAQERATALALLWAKSVDDAEAKERQRETEAARRYDSLLARAEAINRGSGLRLSVGTIGVLTDASREANAARPPAEHQEPAETVSGTTDEREIAVAWVKASEAYADAFGKWQACVNWVEQLRAAEAQ